MGERGGLTYTKVETGTRLSTVLVLLKIRRNCRSRRRGSTKSATESQRRREFQTTEETDDKDADDQGDDEEHAVELADGGRHVGERGSQSLSLLVDPLLMKQDKDVDRQRGEL